MAEIKITIAELIDILAANNILQNFMSDIHFEGDYITFNFHTGQFFPRYIPVSLLFQNFVSDIITFEISTNWMSDKFFALLPVKTNKFIKLKFPKLMVNIHNISDSFLNGLHFKDIQYENGMFQMKFQTKEN